MNRPQIRLSQGNHLSRRVTASVILAAAWPVASLAQGVDLTWIPGTDISSLELPDNTWDEGSDWGFAGDTSEIDAWATENWIGTQPVDFSLSVHSDADLPIIGLEKTVANDTGGSWPGFRIDLVPETNHEIIVDENLTGSSHFDSVTVISHGDGSVSIIWDGGAALGDGQGAVMFTAFGVFGTFRESDASFSMTQTPIPVPGSLALFVASGVIALRRRRSRDQITAQPPA